MKNKFSSASLGFQSLGIQQKHLFCRSLMRTGSYAPKTHSIHKTSSKTPHIVCDTLKNQQFILTDLRDKTRHRLRLLSFSTPENSRLGSFLTGVLWLRLRLNIWLVLKTLALFNQFSWFISTLAKAYNLPEYRTDLKTDQNGESLYQSSRNRYVGRVSKAKNFRAVL